MGTIAIFPSLSRVASMDSSEQAADDTIRDQMDSGYTATRPRFTRERRTWNVNHRNLTGEDVRALRNFRANTVQRGALPFYYPNLLKNGSFEVPAPDENSLVECWTAQPTTDFSVALSSQALDGSNSIQVTSLGGSVPANSFSQGGFAFADNAISVTPGEVYQGNFSYYTLAQSSGTCLGYFLNLFLSDGSIQQVFSPQLSLASTVASWVSYSGNVTIPAPTGSRTIQYATFEIYVQFDNTTSSPITLTAGEVSILFDCVALARTSAPADQVQMAGSEPISTLVRFAANKLPQFSDLGWIKGGKSYGCTFALEEV